MAKRKMGQRKLTSLAAFKIKAEAMIVQLAKDRDELRALVSKYTDILESTDEGVRAFQDAIDTLSTLL